MIAILILVEMSTGVCWLGITYDTIIDIFVLGNTYHTEVVCHKTFYNHKWFVVNIFSHHLLCIIYVLLFELRYSMQFAYSFEYRDAIRHYL